MGGEEALLAEIHHKISRSGSNLSDRLEDQLTGDFFGAIRYLPFQRGLKQVLEGVRFESAGQGAQPRWQQHLDSMLDYDCTLRFWPRHPEGEIDLLLDHPDVVIGIEIKYYSGISSDDGEVEAVSPEESCHQLARYARMLEDIRNGRPAYLVFLAPFDVLLPVESDMKNRSVIHTNVQLGFLGWQNVLEQVQMIDTSSYDTGQQMIISDVRDLLVKKGFERFRGMLTGVRHLTINEQAYHYRLKSDKPRMLNWAISSEIKEEHYVFNK